MSENTSSDHQEIWKPILGYEGLYSVSNLGRVMSHRNEWCFRDLIMKQSKDKAGYLALDLRKNKCATRYLVHRLVLLAFIGPNPDKPVTNHKNGQRGDNRLENIEWCTQSENCQYSYDVLGRQACKGSKHGQSIFTEETVLEIRRQLQAGVRVMDVAKAFSADTSTITRIKQRELWRHI